MKKFNYNNFIMNNKALNTFNFNTGLIVSKLLGPTGGTKNILRYGLDQCESLIILLNIQERGIFRLYKWLLKKLVPFKMRKRLHIYQYKGLYSASAIQSFLEGKGWCSIDFYTYPHNDDAAALLFPTDGEIRVAAGSKTQRYQQSTVGAITKHDIRTILYNLKKEEEANRWKRN